MLPAMRRIIASALPSAVLVPALLLQAATGLPARAADGFIGAELALALPEDAERVNDFDTPGFVI